MWPSLRIVLLPLILLPSLSAAPAKDEAGPGARGVELLARGRYAEARTLFDRALALDPADATALANRCTARYKLQDYDGAIADYQAAVALRPKVKGPLALSVGDAYYRRSRSRLEAGKPDDALKDLYAAVRLDPRNAPALAGIGTLAVRQGDHATALPYLDRALKLRPDLLEGRLSRAAALRAMGRTAEALKDETRARELEAR